jgi:dienelactone hydrolase
MRKTCFSKFKRRFEICLVLSFLFYMSGGVGSAVACNGLPHVELPALTGTYGVGTVVLPLVDDARLEDMTPEPDDYREIMVQVWYPIEKQRSGRTVPYLDLPSLSYLVMESITSFMPSGPQTGTAPSTALETPMRGDEYSHLTALAPRHTFSKEDLRTRANRGNGAPIPLKPGRLFDIPMSTHAIYSAPPAAAAGPFPVLIFSPGFGEIYSEYQSFFENIVSRGYVVAAINHPYTSGITVSPDGRMAVTRGIRNLEELEERHGVLVEDIEFLAAGIETLLQQQLGLALNANEIGFFGHSIGGSAAVEACLEWPQCKGAINMDGSMRGQNYTRPIDKPIFLMLGQNHTLEIDATLELAWRNMTRNGFMMHLDGAEHPAFTDLKLILSQIVPPAYLENLDDAFGTIDGQRAVHIVRQYIIAFFDAYLKGAPVEEITAKDYPEAVLETTSDIVVDY